MIYDGFMFFNEFEMLELRLRELESVVDRHVLVESSITHSGRPKPLYFLENRHRFLEYLPKIEHVMVLDTPQTSVTWDREDFQRNAMLRGMPRLSPTDQVIVADVDEIPKAETLKKVLPVRRPMSLLMRSYGGYLNARSGDWCHAKLVPGHALTEATPNKIRHDIHDGIADAGWHFSYLGGPQKVHEKMNSFSHQEDSVQRWNKPELLEKHLSGGHGVFGGPMHFERIDSSFPKYVVEHPERFPGMIWPVS